MDFSSSTMKSWQRLSSSSVVAPGRTKGSIISSTLAAKRPAARILSCSAGVLMVTVIGRGFVSKRRSWYKARLFLTTPHACRHSRWVFVGFLVKLVPKPPVSREDDELPIGTRGGSTRPGVFYDQRVNATNAGSGRPFWTPNPLLEPQDGSFHLRRT